MNTRISSAIETSVYVLVTVMTPRYSTADPYSFLHPSRQTPLRRNRERGPPDPADRVWTLGIDRSLRIRTSP